MIIKNQISLKRLILIAPPEGKHERLQEFFEHLQEDISQIKKYVDEVVILYSLDDKEGRVEASKMLIEKTGGFIIKLNGYGHFNVTELKLIEGLISHGAPLTRIPEVLDVWMDSGSMPYAQMHYPFENKGEMEASFPADFIAEYVGQVRAWFYVMHVLGVLLDIKKDSANPPPEKGESEGVSQRGIPQSVTLPNPLPDQVRDRLLSGREYGATPAFLNVITTGVINGNDGRKMSKSYGNYPDPKGTIEKYGADPIRFYMLNSPLLSGGDMDFKEEGIVETIKRVMLPLWNTYSFFTTYANIDGWEKDETEVWFSRHAESTSNVAGKMSDGTDDPELTEKGKEQAKEAGRNLEEQGKNFDIIIHTELKRTENTAKIIGDTLGFFGEYISDIRFIEQSAGEYAGKTLEEIAHMGGLASAEKEHHDEIRKIYKNNSVENIEQFEKRILDAYEDILKKYAGKKILIVGHSGTSRPIQAKYFGKGSEKAHFGSPIQNADPFRLMTTPLVNELDRWILSKLQVLIAQVHDAMDGYDVSRACRAIVDYMDELTNWYVRLSRRRFWESGMTEDKRSAYETLYTVLTETAKLLAPYMPFMSESIWKGLTDTEKTDTHTDTQMKTHIVSETKNDSIVSSVTVPVPDNSVHLQYITRPNRHLIDNALNRDMEICEHIVSLGLALRSRKNIRVRQPLLSITITETLSEYYQNIIRDELNVKSVLFENPEKLAKKICKPDARKIGPKYGKDVQYIITQAKEGNFVENPDGTITVSPPDKGGSPTVSVEDGGVGIGNTEQTPLPPLSGGLTPYILELGEYTLEYIPLEGVGDVEGGYGMVISLDTAITESLKLEGYARDLIRAIQDLRKEAEYNVTDRIRLSISDGKIEDILREWQSFIEKETLSQIENTLENPDKVKLLEDEEMGNIEIMIGK